MPAASGHDIGPEALNTALEADGARLGAEAEGERGPSGQARASLLIFS